MKTLLLMVVLSAGLVAQPKPDSLVWFTSVEVNGIANRFQVLNYKLAWHDSLRTELKAQLLSCSRTVTALDSVVSFREQQIKRYESNEALDAKNVELLKKQIEAMKPTVFESPVLWCITGLGIGYALFHK